MIKMFMFDFDGTVADTLDTISYFCNKSLNEFNIPPIEKNEYKYLVGRGAKILVEGMLKHQNVYSEELYNKVYPFYVDLYDNNFLYLTKVYDGVLDTLKELKKRGFKLSVISNKPDRTLKQSVHSLFGDDLFDLYFGQREGIPIKPDPKGPNDILSRLSISGNECVYVGDTSTDMKTGKGIGAYTVGVLWGFRDFKELSENGADLIIEKPQQLLDII